MGKKLSADQIERYERDGFASRLSYRHLALALLGLAAAAIISGCASPDHSSEQNRQGGFYGGMSGGLSR